MQYSSPQWMITEKIISILEKVISPDAKVEHNVKLPVIGSPSGKMRQCDIVIISGKVPRQYTAIVEVQKRNRKPDITTFHGWHRKMQQVGAQRLICVSALGYPKSIIEDVKIRIGPTVTLMTLQELEGKIPIDILPFTYRFAPRFEVEDNTEIKLDIPKDTLFDSQLQIENTCKIISINNNIELFSIDEFITNILNYSINMFDRLGIKEPDTYKAEIEITGNEQNLLLKLENINLKINKLFGDNALIWLNYKNYKIKIDSWIIKLNLCKYDKVEEVSRFKYHQEFDNGVLAWIVICQIEIENERKDIQFIFKPDENGLLQMVVGNNPLSFNINK